ncbi:hypothetical protein K431DRAFT_346872 [Polychaeton citri CBS 116435]|uniref:GPI-anchored cell wall organization protein Ecm33 n=1 Tax=Polychaeton citri CBS 116435 TaxID=1314669 RepID=A0A9P4Q552_9PEZI|nr:hypothetical protein K431DRAFT_346872 [Polychaeton citri CBS 116435]
MSMKYIVPALAVAGRVAAQSSCSAATTTIQNAGDASAIAANCRTFSGDIAIATGTTDEIDLSGQLQEIHGSLIANNVTGISSISSSSLQTITDSFELNGLTLLSTLNFPVLTAVDSINWEALPALEGLSFTNAVQEATTVNIQNTDMNTLDGINLQVVDTLILVNNPFLSKVDMQLGNVSTGITVESNGRDLEVSFPNMIWANNITIRNASQVSIPSLASVNGSVGFYSCSFDSLAAPNLTRVGGGLSLISNEGLSNISFPELTTVNGALNVANNTDLGDISFPELQKVQGAVDFQGNFSSVELPKINLVQGAFNVKSSSDISDDCSHFSSIKGSNNVIRGKYFCKGSTSQNNGGSGTSSGGGSSSESGGSSAATSGNFAASVMVPTAGSLLGVVAAIFGIF